MKILSVRNITRAPSARGFQTIARFNLELNPDFLVYDFDLVKAPDGHLEVYAPPSANGSKLAAMSPTFRKEIAAAAFLELGNLNREQYRATA